MNNPRLVLIVDDELDILDIYREKLVRNGFEVVTATDGAEGVELAKQKHPDLILMDVKMPVMDGITALMKLKEDPTTKDIKVVFLTAFSDPNVPEVDIKAAKEMGAIDFIKKGTALDEVVEKVKQYLA